MGAWPAAFLRQQRGALPVGLWMTLNWEDQCLCLGQGGCPEGLRRVGQEPDAVPQGERQSPALPGQKPSL